MSNETLPVTLSPVRSLNLRIIDRRSISLSPRRKVGTKESGIHITICTWEVKNPAMSTLTTGT